MTKKIVNVRAKPGSGVKHDKHAPASKADIAAAEIATEETESGTEDNDVPTMDNTKAEILAYCDAHDLAYAADSNKAELIDAINES